MDLKQVNKKIDGFHDLIASQTSQPYEGQLKVGVDLGTANIVIAVVDENDQPIAGVSRPASIVRDGIVVDYIGATKILKELKLEIEDILGTQLKKVATAIPPGIIEGNTKVICNVVESCGFEVIKVIEEPTAAARVLGISNGAVVDVGGGTTGISIIENNEVIFTTDEATGGTHMTLVTAGAYNMPPDQAEVFKKDKSRASEIFTVVQPVIEKMASIVKSSIHKYKVTNLYVVGGACSFDQFESVFKKEIGVETIKPHHPLLITPLGIAMYACE